MRRRGHGLAAPGERDDAGGGVLRSGLFVPRTPLRHHQGAALESKPVFAVYHKVIEGREQYHWPRMFSVAVVEW